MQKVNSISLRLCKCLHNTQQPIALHLPGQTDKQKDIHSSITTHLADTPYLLDLKTAAIRETDRTIVAKTKHAAATPPMTMLSEAEGLGMGMSELEAVALELSEAEGVGHS